MRLSLVSRYTKAVPAAVGMLAMGVTQGLITGTAAHWTAVVVSLATLAGVYQAPANKP